MESGRYGDNVSVEETLRQLEEAKKQKEKAYTTLKGMVEGIRLGRLGSVEKAFLKLIETMFDGFKNAWDDIFTNYELQLQTIKRVDSLETKMKELENNILQLRQTLDEMFHEK